MTTDPRDAIIAELREVIRVQKEELVALRAEVADLREKLRKSSSNSSKPPSSDGPGTPRSKKPNRRKQTGKKRGAQPGHRKHERALLPVEQVDVVHDVKPTECEACGRHLCGEDLNPLRHQVTELPLVKPSTEETRVHTLLCDCGHLTTAVLPVGTPRGAFGPGVVATVAVLIGAYRLSKRLTVDLLNDLLGLRMSLGAVINCQREALAALRPCVEEAAAHVQSAPVKHADETGWRVAGKRAWMWAVVTPLVTFFTIQATRSADAARVALDQATGILISDRFAGYHWWPLWQRQICWSHLIRDFLAIEERGGESLAIGKGLGGEAQRLFSWHHRVRDGTLAPSTFRIYARSLKARVRGLLEQGTKLTEHGKTARTCARMLKVFPAFWTFVDHPEVEPTNNAAEQAVRHGVMFRKTSQGTQSSHGSEFVGGILTVRATLRQQCRPILQFVIDACRAHLLGLCPPSLLPLPDNGIVSPTTLSLAA